MKFLYLLVTADNLVIPVQLCEMCMHYKTV